MASEEISKLHHEEKVLATIETISLVTRHPNADSLYLARVQGYNVIINLEKMFETLVPNDILGVKVVFVQIDTIMPETFQKEGFWNYLKKTSMGNKVSSAKLRGAVVSQGLLCPMELVKRVIPEVSWDSLECGTNVTNLMGVRKFYADDDPEGPNYFPSRNLKNCSKESSSGPAYLKPFPTFLVKTDEPRLQTHVYLIRDVKDDRRFTATIKYDGQSTTWYCKKVNAAHQEVSVDQSDTVISEINNLNKSIRNGFHLGMCTRNYEVDLEYDDKTNDRFRAINAKYGIFSKLERFFLQTGRSIAIQAELYGPDINGNRMKASAHALAVFNILDLDTGFYLLHNEVVEICLQIQLPLTQVLFENKTLSELNLTSVDDFVAFSSKQCYPGASKILAEGIVVKTSDNMGSYFSFKVISPEYLLKHNI